MAFRLLDATPADLSAIRDLQLASWRDAYRGVLSDAFLGAPVEHALTGRWATHPGQDWVVRCAWQGARLVGFVSVDLAHDGGPYVDNLHVRPDAKGQGAGRALMADAARAVLARCGTSLWLTVMRDNAGARAFYTSVGGVEGAQMEEVLYGEPVVTYPVRWDGLDRLATLG